MKTNKSIQDSDHLVAQILDDITAKVLRGEVVDFPAIVAENPSAADELQELESIVNVLAEWGTEVSVNSASAPQQLGDFRIVRELARGGMGIVYEAEQLSLNRRVALKVLPFAALLDERQLRRFQTEARAAAILQHDNIVNVYSVGCERGVHYYAMKLIDGPSLAEFISRIGCQSVESRIDSQPVQSKIGDRPVHDHRNNNHDSLEDNHADTKPIASLSTQHARDRAGFYRTIAKLGIDVARALDYGHEEGVVHRDIKPANLLLNSAGRIHIADFGLARIHQSAADVTRSGDMLGTLRYMSPEQVAGNSSVDARADVYSLGVTLYEALTGRAAFVGDDRQQLIRSVLEEEPIALQKLDSQLPYDLATVIHKAINKDTSERYQTAADFADDLQRFVDSRAIRARPTTRLDRVRKFTQRNPVVTLLFTATVALLGLLAISSAGVAWKFARIAQGQRAETRRQTLGVYARDMRLVRLALDEGDVVEAERNLLRWVPEETTSDSQGRDINNDMSMEDVRGFEWYHLWQRCHDPEIEHTISHPLIGIDLTFSPDGSQLADGFFTDEVPVWLIGGETPALSRKLPIHSVQPTVTRTIGDWLLIGTGKGRLFVWDWTSAELIDEIDTSTIDASVRAVDVDAKRKLLAIGVVSTEEKVSVMVWDLDRGEFVLTTEEESTDGRPFVAFGLDGNLLMSSEDRSSIRILDPRTGKLIGERHFDGKPTHFAINHQRTRLALAINRNRGDIHDAQVIIASLANNELHELSRMVLGDIEVQCLGFSDDERELAFGDSSGQLYRMNLANETIVAKQLHFGPINSVKYSPGGKRLATTGWDCQTHLLRRDDKPRSQPLVTRLQRTETKYGNHVDFLDHENTVCSSHGPTQIDLWDARTGQIIKTVKLSEGPWDAIRLGADRDRQRLAIARCNWPPQDDVADEVLIWDRKLDGFQAKRYSIPGGVITIVVPFSPDGRYVGVTGPGHATLIDIVDGTTRKIEFEGWVKGCAFSNDGKTFAVSPTAGAVHFYDVATLTEVRSPIVMDSISTGCIRYAPQGNSLASTGFEGRFNLCDVKTGERFQVGEQCPRYLATFDFSPDGSRIATGSMDGRIRIFSTETGDELFSVAVEAYYGYVSFSSDGQSLAVVSGRDRIVVHAPDQGQLAKLSRAELGDIICRDVTFHERPNPHAMNE